MLKPLPADSPALRRGRGTPESARQEGEPVPSGPERRVPAVPRRPQSFPRSAWGQGPLCPADLGPSHTCCHYSGHPFHSPKCPNRGNKLPGRTTDGELTPGARPSPPPEKGLGAMVQRWGRRLRASRKLSAQCTARASPRAPRRPRPRGLSSKPRRRGQAHPGGVPPACSRRPPRALGPTAGSLQADFESRPEILP